MKIEPIEDNLIPDHEPIKYMDYQDSHDEDSVMVKDSFNPDHEPIKYKDYRDSRDVDSAMVPLHTSSTSSVNPGYEPTIDPVLKSNHILLVCSNVISSLTPVSTIITSFVPAFKSASAFVSPKVSSL